MSRRLRNDFDEEIEELDYKFRFRHPNDRKRNRLGNNEPAPKIRRVRPRHDVTDYEES